MTSMYALQTDLTQFNAQFHGDGALKPDKLKADYADINTWHEMKARNGLREMGEIIQEHAPLLLKRVLSLVPVIFPTCKPYMHKVSCVPSNCSPRELVDGRRQLTNLCPTRLFCQVPELVDFVGEVHVGFGRIVVSENEAPIILVNRVISKV